MPGWYERTKALREEGKLRFAAIIEEQHPDRCRLFLQWKQMELPVLVDSLDLLGVSAVPIFALVDEHGVVRSLKATPERLERFIGESYPAPAELPSPKPPADPEVLERRLTAGGGVEPQAWMALGDALFLRGREADLERSAAAYSKAIALGGPPEARFRLGAVLRRRHESSRRAPGDFQAALAAWEEALELRPEQYIWRRRIQQYGPRLTKPYAFYDWVDEARREIAARGDTPVALALEPGGAEIARPSKDFEAGKLDDSPPDPGRRIPRDDSGLIGIEVAAAPASIAPGGTVRVHVLLLPDSARKVHWNDEAGETVLWIECPPGVEVERRRHALPPLGRPSSEEPRSIEFELRLGREPPRGEKEEKPRSLTIPAYILYSICEDREGACRYLRQEFSIRIKVR